MQILYILSKIWILHLETCNQHRKHKVVGIPPENTDGHIPSEYTDGHIPSEIQFARENQTA